MMASATLQPQETMIGCRALAITNIDPRADEQTLVQMLSQAGTVREFRLMPDVQMQHGGLASAIVEYEDHPSADMAIATLNGQQVLDYCITMQWSIGHKNREDTSQHFHIWIGDLALDVDDRILMEAFSSERYPSVSDGRVLWDPNTGKSRGYGFVSFREKPDAERALQQMNGAQLGSKRIRCNWAHQRNNMFSPPSHIPAAGGVGSGSYASGFAPPSKPSLNYNTVFSQSNPGYSTIYVGNVPQNTTVDMLSPMFAPYGYVMDIKVNAERAFAFVKMDSHENATYAICWLNGLLFNGQKLKVAWGRDRSSESPYPSGRSVAGQQQVPMSNAGFYGYPVVPGMAQQSNSSSPNGQMQVPAGYEQYYNQYYAQYYAQVMAAGYDPMTGQPFAPGTLPAQQQQAQQKTTSQYHQPSGDDTVLSQQQQQQQQ